VAEILNVTYIIILVGTRRSSTGQRWVSRVLSAERPFRRSNILADHVISVPVARPDSPLQIKKIKRRKL
jgi:hypothetical protein